MSVPLNQIFFGPPGTGKTYATLAAALEILDPIFFAAHHQDRRRLQQRCAELQAQQRLGFVTFHQSFCYEDFVEGLRATCDPETGQLSYAVVEGVFKRFCTLTEPRQIQPLPEPIELSDRRIWKMSLGATQSEAIIQECLAGSYVLLGHGGRINFQGCGSREAVQARFQEAGQTVASGDYALTCVTLFVTQMQPGDLVVVPEGNFRIRAIGEITGSYLFKPHPEDRRVYAQYRPVRWLRIYEPALPHTELMRVRFSQQTLYELHRNALDRERLGALLKNPLPTPTEPADPPRVLIIDEINRGSVAQIFGELISLLEPSRRAGAAEETEVILPYSRSRFRVPGNLYLIATMNSADRSLTGLDLALRRRFVFREMPPRPELLNDIEVAGINLGHLLDVLNQRLDVLLDRDHCLGHTYFLPLREQPTLEKLAEIFRLQLLPLLQEYFFDDWERLRWVLNDQNAPPDGEPFVREATAVGLRTLFGPEVGSQLHTQRWQLNPAAWLNPASYRNILGQGPNG